MEGVGVGVDEAGDGQAGQALGVSTAGVIARPGRADTDDPVAVHLERARRAALAGRPTRPTRSAATSAPHDPTRSTKAVIRSMKSARCQRSNCAQVVSVVGSWTRSRKSVPSRWSSSCWNVPAVRPALDLLVGRALAVEVADVDVDVAPDVAPQVGDGEAALVDLDQLVVQRLDHRVDDHGQRDAGLVGVAGVVLDLDHRDAHGLVHLVGGQAGAVGVAHRVDHVVDEPLHLRRRQLVGRQLAGPLPEHRVPHGGDLADGHAMPCASSRDALARRHATLAHRQPHAPLLGHLDRPLVAGVGVADDAHPRIGRRGRGSASRPPRRCRRPGRPCPRGSSARCPPRRRGGC